MRDYCFVIQPFDGGKFDKRYVDVFEPAIRKANVEPYRVDKDPSVSVPIESIEEGIKNSRFCMADITTDNPNVWYEVGFAFALGKDVVLLCSNERITKYPFDIQHRTVISYKVESPSDFSALSDAIVARIEAVLKQPITISSPVCVNADISGLTYQEISTLGAILKRQDTPESGVLPQNVSQSLAQCGLNEIAFSLAAKKLSQKAYIKLEFESDFHGNEYFCYRITDVGWEWILKNEDKFDTRVTTVTVEAQPQNDDDLPF